MCLHRHCGARSPWFSSGGQDSKVMQVGHVDGQYRENLHLPAEESQRLVALHQVWRADGTLTFHTKLHENEQFDKGLWRL